MDGDISLGRIIGVFLACFVNQIMGNLAKLRILGFKIKIDESKLPTSLSFLFPLQHFMQTLTKGS